MNKKAFTLVELLAVIVIIGIILLIAIPSVTKIVTQAKKDTLVSSAKLIDRSIKTDYAASGATEYKMDNNGKLWRIKSGVDDFEIKYTGKVLPINNNNVFFVYNIINGTVYIFEGALCEKTENYCISTGTTISKLVATDVVPINDVVDDTCFEFTPETKTITSYNNSCPKAVTIPSKINGVDVLIIGNAAFENKGLTKVTIPSGVTTIEPSAFSNNELSSITIPTTVTTIGDGAFYSNDITSVTIPNSVTTIGLQAFSANQLTSVTLGSSVSLIDQYAFSNNLITNIIIPNSISILDSYAFENNRITAGNAIIQKASGAFTLGFYVFMNNGSNGTETIEPTYQP